MKGTGLSVRRQASTQDDRVAAALWAVAAVAVGWNALVITDWTLDFFHRRSLLPGAYNHYFLSLLDGRFDIPPRMGFIEAQYGPDGRAYLYYGILPALLRAPFQPFLDLESRSLAPLVVWAGSTGAGLLATDLWRLAVQRTGLADVRAQAALAGAGAIGIWFASPIPVIAADAPIYNEPVALALMLSMAFLRLSLPLAWGARAGPGRILALAAVAALAVHARPHVALGLYAGWGLLLLILARSGALRRASMPAASAAAALILAASGAGYLAINAARFGDALNYMGGGPVVYGLHHLGFAPQLPPDPDAVPRGGRFEATRIISNGAAYLTGKPAPALERLLGARGRHEFPPNLLLLWGPWIWAFAAALVLLLARRGGLAGIARPALAWPPLLATAIGAALMLAYVTVTFRYTAELFPLVLAAVLLAMPEMAARIGAARPPLRLSVLAAPLATLLLATAVTGALAMLATDYHSHWSRFQQGAMHGWSRADCLRHLEEVAPHAPAGPEACR